MVKIAVLGYGTVGSGVVEVIRTNQDVIGERLGEELCIKYVLDLKEFPGDPVQEIITHDFEEIVSDDEVKIVVEVMGGIEPAYTFVKRCLEAGKSVATSNKALVAKHGAQLQEIAREHNVNFLFEASVGGGIPILRPLRTSLTGDVIEEIAGILNGTTNYMMTKMFYEGADYDEVLREAQANGFAERNPEADVEGYDACRKIAILSSIISGKQVDFEDIYCEGITKITVEDMKYARAMGMTIKLLATCRRDGEKLNAMVGALPSAGGASALCGERRVQLHLRPRQHAGGRHVLRQRRGQAPHRQRGGGRRDRGGPQPGPEPGRDVDAGKTGPGGYEGSGETVLRAHEGQPGNDAPVRRRCLRRGAVCPRRGAGG